MELLARMFEARVSLVLDDRDDETALVKGEGINNRSIRGIVENYQM